MDDKCDEEILIHFVEGHQGMGKTNFFKNLLIEESKRRGTLYTDIKDIVEANDWEKQLGILIGYSPDEETYKNNSINIFNQYLK